MRQLLFILLLMLVPLGTRAQSADMNLDSIYMSYMSDSSKAQIMKLRNEMARIEQQAQEREKRQMVWYAILAACGIFSLITTIDIFRSVFQGHGDAPLINKLKAGAICLAGGLAIFLINALWLYSSFEGSYKMKKLIVFVLLFALGTALWIYTKRLQKNQRQDEIYKESENDGHQRII